MDFRTMRVLYRSVWLPAALAAVFLMIALGSMVIVSSRSLGRLPALHEHLNLLQQLELLGKQLQDLLVEELRTGRGAYDSSLRIVRRELSSLTNQDGYLASEVPGRLEKASALLSDPQGSGAAELAGALEEVDDATSAEAAAHETLVRTIERDTRVELLLSIGLIVALPLGGGALLFLLRRRFFLPLDNLRYLMNLLGQQEYRTVPTSGLDPLLRPVFENYNVMAARLLELEHQHQDRQRSLEEEVRAATGTLLQQQRELARAERLAAMGELAAGVAHELRNPLAGIQMALSGMRRDIRDPDLASRLDLVIAQLKRVTRLLNDLLSASRPTPEPATDVQVAVLVRELLALVRYQLPERVNLEEHVAEGLRCRLPEDALRRALLNLVLNAAQAIGEGPGEIVIRASVKNERLRLSVCDNGPGFPDELLQTGIQPFTTLREGGTGLGLALVRRFASDLHGELRMKNVEPRGACVELELPCKGSHD